MRLAPALGACAVAALVSAVIGGPLQPAAGPVAATMKPLTEVEPRVAITAANTPGDATAVFKITQPGSYYLTGEVAVAAGKHGILITANYVTIDLNGFSIAPGAGVSTAQYGVYAPASRNVTVRNGTVRSMAAAGIGVVGDGCRVENVSAYSCTAAGIYVAGAGTLIEGCVVDTSTGLGIHCGPKSTVRGCVSVGAQTGIDAGDGSLIIGCVAVQNTGTGIDCSCGSTVLDCESKGNGGLGYFMCQSSMSRCHSTGNAGAGVQAGGLSSVRDCFVANNGQGILCQDRCLVTGNRVVLGGSEGILASGDDNRIERNSIDGATKGIKVDGINNLITGNSVAEAVTAYQFVAGNRYGPVVNATGGVTPAVSGSSAASTLGTTDPNANIVH